MNTKALVAIMICGILLATVIFAYGDYQNSVGYKKGYSMGQESQLGTGNQNRDLYQQGYNAGLKAAQNGTG